MRSQTSAIRQERRGAPAPARPEAAPPWPTPPEDVLRLIRRGVVSSRLVFPEGGPSREVVVWRAPPITDRALLARVEEHLAAVEAWFEPMDRAELLARLLALISHYRVEPQPQQIEMMMADDWAEDLGGYPAWVVEAAARHWRRTKRFKPQICEMIALCEAECGERRIHRDRLRAMVDAARRSISPHGRRFSALVGGSLARVPAESWD